MYRMNQIGLKAYSRHSKTGKEGTLPVCARFLAAAESLGYQLLRAAFGIIMMTHGIPKLLGISHGSMANPMAASINLIENVLHLPWPSLFAMFIALLESIGGALLAIGLASRIIAFLMAFQMLAICYILSPKWVWIDRGIEYPVLMFFLAMYIVLKESGSRQEMAVA